MNRIQLETVRFGKPVDSRSDFKNIDLRLAAGLMEYL